MTDDLATKIAAMVSELGKLRSQVNSEPSRGQEDIISRTCTGQNAENAIMLALGCLFANTDPTYSHRDGLIDLMLKVSTLLTFLHKDRSTRRVTRGEVLRALAQACDETENEAVTAIEGLIKKLRDAGADVQVLRVPRPSDDDDRGGSKPGAN